MIPSRFGRLLGAVLLLVPSLALGQSMIQQPNTGLSGSKAEPLPNSLIKLYQNDVGLDSRLSTVEGTLNRVVGTVGSFGNAASKNVGVTVGTVADGGALTAETNRALAAEGANTTAISGEVTRAKAAEAALQAAIGAATNAYAVNYTAQSLTAPQQLQARQNIGAAASGDTLVLGTGSTATTPSAGDNTTKVATTAFSTGALSSYASTVASTYLTQSAAASTYAPLASPALTGTPTVPTAAASTNSTQAASTAYADRASTTAAAASVPNVAIFSGLTIKPGASAGSQISVVASSAVLRGASAGLSIQNVSVTISTGLNGAGGLDTGSTAANTWYALFIIAKPDGTKAGLYSLSATAPTLPSGYAYASRAGWLRTDGSANFVPIVQSGRQARYKVDGGHVYPVVSGANGDVVTPTWVAIPISGFAPSTAVGGLFATYATSGSSNVATLAPNNSYGAYNQGQSSSAPPPPINSANGVNGASGSSGQQTMHFEGTSVYAAVQANAAIVCLGWEDNL